MERRTQNTSTQRWGAQLSSLSSSAHSVTLSTQPATCTQPELQVSTLGQGGLLPQDAIQPVTQVPSPGTLLKVHAFDTLPRLPQSCSPCGTVMWWCPGHPEGSSPHLELAPQVGHLVQPVLLHTPAAAPLARVSTSLRLHLVEGQTPQSENLASCGSKPWLGRL